MGRRTSSTASTGGRNGADYRNVYSSRAVPRRSGLRRLFLRVRSFGCFLHLSTCFCALVPCSFSSLSFFRVVTRRSLRCSVHHFAASSSALVRTHNLSRKTSLRSFGLNAHCNDGFWQFFQGLCS